MDVRIKENRYCTICEKYLGKSEPPNIRIGVQLCPECVERLRNLLYPKGLPFTVELDGSSVKEELLTILNGMGRRGEI